MLLDTLVLFPEACVRQPGCADRACGIWDQSLTGQLCPEICGAPDIAGAYML